MDLAMAFDRLTARAARALLDWTQEDLAEHARLGVSTVYAFESGKRELPPRRADAIKAALEAAGVEFLDGDGPGVRLKRVRS